MRREANVKIEEVAYHRNGVGGEPFYVIKFISTEDGRASNMVGVVYPENGYVSVFDRDLLGQGVIAFGYNSFRGDHFEGHLRHAIMEHEAGADERCAEPVRKIKERA